MRLAATPAELEGEGAAAGVAAESLPRLSMPAAELFSICATALATAAARGDALPLALMSVGDCEPAAAAANAATSGVPQMRAPVRAMRTLTLQWLAVA
eukprot:457179-Pleurochrysis_carterae.AAC.1